jgi:hypothetical protein
MEALWPCLRAMRNVEPNFELEAQPFVFWNPDGLTPGKKLS